MTDTFITEHYFWVAIPAQILGFILVYATARHSHDSLNQQAVVMMCAWLWPFTFMLVTVCIALFITYAVLTGIVLVATWLADKTIGKLIKEQRE
tara:strand:+ start:143 stop:424 length:282 start_codon:yes stop_codon:yes gene_type:complete